MLLLLVACSSTVDKPLDVIDPSDALCRVLQGQVDAEIVSLPAGSNGPEVYAPDTHQSIALNNQGDGLFTGSVGFTPPEAGTYFLAFGEPTSLLVRPELDPSFEGTTLSPSCPEVVSLVSVELDLERVTLQLSDVPEPAVSFASGGL